MAEAAVRVRRHRSGFRLRNISGGGMKPIKNIDDPRYVKAMSHPLRVRILAMLDERTASPNQLAGWLGASLGTVAYHVRTLEQLGLIQLVDETRVRGAVEHHYRAKARPNVTVEGWAKAPPIAKQAAVGSSLDVIGEYARVSAAAGRLRPVGRAAAAGAAAGSTRRGSPSCRRRATSCSSRPRRSKRQRPSGSRAIRMPHDVVEVGRRPDAVRGGPAVRPRGRRQARHTPAATRAPGCPHLTRNPRHAGGARHVVLVGVHNQRDE